MNQSTFTPQIMAKMALCVALISVSGYIAFPLPFSPAMITASTAAMCLAAFVLTPKQTFITIAVYLLLGGVVGLPILPGGTAGLGRLLGPTGGFYFAWAVAFPAVSMLKGKENSLKRYILTGVIVSIPIVYAGGLLSMMLNMDITLEQAFVMAVFPFIPGDILKCIAAALIGVRVNKALGNK